MKKILLGAHMPTTGGFYHAAEFGQAIGCNAMQIFTKSNRQWQAKPIEQDDIKRFKTAVINNKIEYVVAHACYLINLASPDLQTQNKSIAALEIELNRCHDLGITDLVLHPGSRLEQTEEAALKQVAKNINVALKNSNPKTNILIETMAGQGTTIGNSFEQIAKIIEGVDSPSRIKTCVDTCHIFAAGYAITSESEYDKTWSLFDRIIGLEKLALIHLNDSKKNLGSKVDRHAEIGAGEIGINAFRLIMNDQNLLKVPKILETPKTDLEDDKKSLQILIDLLTKENAKHLEDTNLKMYLR